MTSCTSRTCKQATTAGMKRIPRQHPVCRSPGSTQPACNAAHVQCVPCFADIARRHAFNRVICRSTAASVQLLQLLEEGNSSAAVSELVDQLCNSGKRFEERLIGGGPWVVCYQRGSPIAWGLSYSLGKVVNGANTASQDLDPATRTVVSKVQYWGDKLYVTASGKYEPEGTSTSTPKKVNVTVTSGCLHVLGLKIPLPIQGKGSFEVLYLDSRLRVFRAPTSLVVVQVKGMTSLGIASKTE